MCVLVFLGFGLMDPSGHLDFYPNGGESQPGCSVTTFDFSRNSSMLTNLESLGDCSHMKSIRLFNDALLSNTCQHIGYQCDSISSFNQVYIKSYFNVHNDNLWSSSSSKGKCTSCGSGNTQCGILGMEAPKFPTRSSNGVKLFFNTANQAPYCSKNNKYINRNNKYSI